MDLLKDFQSKWQTCNGKQQGTILIWDLTICGTSAVTVAHVFELISEQKCAAFPSVTPLPHNLSMTSVPDHISDTSDNALHFSSSFLPALFCCYMSKIVEPFTDTSQPWCV